MPLNQSSEAGEEDASTVANMDELLVTEIWREVEGRISQAQIEVMVAEAENEYADAVIRSYVPIFIRRQVRAKLADLLKDVGTLHDPQTLHPPLETPTMETPTVETGDADGEAGSSTAATSDQKFAGWLLGFVT
jgi:hypothetical protein